MLALERSQFKWLVKTIAAVTIICFLWQDVLFAQGGVPTWSQARARDSQSPQPVNQIEVPYDIGVTRSVKPSQSDEIIVNIQDAHASVGAQKSISKIIESLVKNYELSLVGLEGAAGTVDTSLVSSFPMESIRKGAAESLLHETKISAGEFYKIVSGEKIELYGAEDMDLYAQNIASFQKLLAQKERIQKELAGLRGVMAQLERKILPDDIVRLNRDGVLQRNGSVKFSEHWKRFKELAAKTGVSYEKLPNVAKLVRTVELEEEIDFKKAEKERALLIDDLKGRLSKPDLERLVLRHLQFQLGKITPGGFHADLAAWAEKAGIDPSSYPNIILYAQYLSVFESIDLAAIFDEAARMEAEVKERLFRSDEERNLDKFLTAIGVLSRFLDAGLSSADDKFYRENRRLFEVSAIESFLDGMAARHGVPWKDQADLGFLGSQIPDAEEFYKHVHARNDALLENLTRRMREKNQHIAALVTGGFHTDGLSDLMQEKQVSHIVLMPKFDEKSGERPYLAVITQKGSFLDREVRVEAQKEAILLVLGIATAGGMDFDEAKRLYLESYERYQGPGTRGQSPVTGHKSTRAPEDQALRHSEARRAEESKPEILRSAQDDAAVATVTALPFTGSTGDMSPDDVTSFVTGTRLVSKRPIVMLPPGGMAMELHPPKGDEPHRLVPSPLSSAEIEASLARQALLGARARVQEALKQIDDALGPAEGARANSAQFFNDFAAGYRPTAATNAREIELRLNDEVSKRRSRGTRITDEEVSKNLPGIVERILIKKPAPVQKAPAVGSRLAVKAFERRTILRNLILKDEAGIAVTASQSAGAIPGYSVNQARADWKDIREIGAPAEAAKKSQHVLRNGLAWVRIKGEYYYFNSRLAAFRTPSGRLKSGSSLKKAVLEAAGKFQPKVLLPAVKEAVPSAEVTEWAGRLVEQIGRLSYREGTMPEQALKTALDKQRVPEGLRPAVLGQSQVKAAIEKAEASILAAKEADVRDKAAQWVRFLDRLSISRGHEPGSAEARVRDSVNVGWRILEDVQTSPVVREAIERAESRLESQKAAVLDAYKSVVAGPGRFARRWVAAAGIGIFLGIPFIVISALAIAAVLYGVSRVLTTNFALKGYWSLHRFFVEQKIQSESRKASRRRREIDRYGSFVASSWIDTVLEPRIVFDAAFGGVAADFMDTQGIDLSALESESAMVDSDAIDEIAAEMAGRWAEGPMTPGGPAIDRLSIDLPEAEAETPPGAFALQQPMQVRLSSAQTDSLEFTVLFTPGQNNYSLALESTGRPTISLFLYETATDDTSVFDPQLSLRVVLERFGDNDEFVVVKIYNDTNPDEGTVAVFHTGTYLFFGFDHSVEFGKPKQGGLSRGNPDVLMPRETDIFDQPAAKGEGALLEVGHDDETRRFILRPELAKQQRTGIFFEPAGFGNILIGGTGPAGGGGGRGPYGAGGGDGDGRPQAESVALPLGELIGELNVTNRKVPDPRAAPRELPDNIRAPVPLGAVEIDDEIRIEISFNPNQEDPANQGAYFLTIRIDDLELEPIEIHRGPRGLRFTLGDPQIDPQVRRIGDRHIVVPFYAKNNDGDVDPALSGVAVIGLDESRRRRESVAIVRGDPRILLVEVIERDSSGRVLSFRVGSQVFETGLKTAEAPSAAAPEATVTETAAPAQAEPEEAPAEQPVPSAWERGMEMLITVLKPLAVIGSVLFGIRAVQWLKNKRKTPAPEDAAVPPQSRPAGSRFVRLMQALILALAVGVPVLTSGQEITPPAATTRVEQESTVDQLNRLYGNRRYLQGQIFNSQRAASAAWKDEEYARGQMVGWRQVSWSQIGGENPPEIWDEILPKLDMRRGRYRFARPDGAGQDAFALKMNARGLTLEKYAAWEDVPAEARKDLLDMSTNATHVINRKSGDIEIIARYSQYQLVSPEGKLAAMFDRYAREPWLRVYPEDFAKTDYFRRFLRDDIMFPSAASEVPITQADYDRLQAGIAKNGPIYGVSLTFDEKRDQHFAYYHGGFDVQIFNPGRLVFLVPDSKGFIRYTDPETKVVTVFSPTEYNVRAGSGLTFGPNWLPGVSELSEKWERLNAEGGSFGPRRGAQKASEPLEIKLGRRAAEEAKKEFEEILETLGRQIVDVPPAKRASVLRQFDNVLKSQTWIDEKGFIHGFIAPYEDVLAVARAREEIVRKLLAQLRENDREIDRLERRLRELRAGSRLAVKAFERRQILRNLLLKNEAARIYVYEPEGGLQLAPGIVPEPKPEPEAAPAKPDEPVVEAPGAPAPAPVRPAARSARVIASALGAALLVLISFQPQATTVLSSFISWARQVVSAQVEPKASRPAPKAAPEARPAAPAAPAGQAAQGKADERLEAAQKAVIVARRELERLERQAAEKQKSADFLQRSLYWTLATSVRDISAEGGRPIPRREYRTVDEKYLRPRAGEYRRLPGYALVVDADTGLIIPENTVKSGGKTVSPQYSRAEDLLPGMNDALMEKGVHEFKAEDGKTYAVVKYADAVYVTPQQELVAIMDDDFGPVNPKTKVRGVLAVPPAMQKSSIHDMHFRYGTDRILTEVEIGALHDPQTQIIRKLMEASDEQLKKALEASGAGLKAYRPYRFVEHDGKLWEVSLGGADTYRYRGGVARAVKLDPKGEYTFRDRFDLRERRVSPSDVYVVLGSDSMWGRSGGERVFDDSVRQEEMRRFGGISIGLPEKEEQGRIFIRTRHVPFDPALLDSGRPELAARPGLEKLKDEMKNPRAKGALEGVLVNYENFMNIDAQAGELLKRLNATTDAVERERLRTAIENLTARSFDYWTEVWGDPVWIQMHPSRIVARREAATLEAAVKEKAREIRELEEKAKAAGKPAGARLTANQIISQRIEPLMNPAASHQLEQSRPYRAAVGVEGKPGYLDEAGRAAVKEALAQKRQALLTGLQRFPRLVLQEKETARQAGLLKGKVDAAKKVLADAGVLKPLDDALQLATAKEKTKGWEAQVRGLIAQFDAGRQLEQMKDVAETAAALAASLQVQEELAKKDSDKKELKKRKDSRDKMWLSTRRTFLAAAFFAAATYLLGWGGLFDKTVKTFRRATTREAWVHSAAPALGFTPAPTAAPVLTGLESPSAVPAPVIIGNQAYFGDRAHAAPVLRDGVEVEDTPRGALDLPGADDRSPEFLFEEESFDRGEDSLGRKWRVVVDSAGRVLEIRVLNILGRHEFSITGNVLIALPGGGFRPAAEVLQIDPQGRVGKPLSRSEIGQIRFKGDIHTDILRAGPKTVKGWNRYAINADNGFTVSDYPLPIDTNRAMDPYKAAEQNRFWLSSIEQGKMLGTIGTATVRTESNKDAVTYQYRYSEVHTYKKAANGDLLYRNGEPQHDTRIEWHTPAGRLEYVYDGNKLTHIVYENGVVKYHYTYEVPAGFFETEKDPAHFPKDRLFSFSEVTGVTASSEAGGVYRDGQTVVLRRDFTRNQIIQNPEAPATLALLRQARSTDVQVYYGPVGLEMGFVKINRRYNTAQVTLLDRPFDSAEGKAQIRGEFQYDVWSPDLSPIAGRPPRLEDLVNRNPGRASRMKVWQGHVKGFDAENRPVTDTEAFLYTGTAPASGSVKLEIIRENGLEVSRRFQDRHETITRDRFGRATKHSSAITVNGIEAAIDESQFVALDPAGNEVWSGRPTAAANSQKAWYFGIDANGHRIWQADGILRSDGAVAIQQYSESTYQHGGWAAIQTPTTTDTYAVSPGQYDLLTHAASPDRTAGLKENSRTRAVTILNGALKTVDREHVRSLERVRRFERTLRLKEEALGVPGSTRSWRTVVNAYQGFEAFPSSTSFIFRGKEEGSSVYSTLPLSGLTELAEFPDEAQDALLAGLQAAGLVAPDITRLADSNLVIRVEEAKDPMTGLVSRLYRVDGDPLERRVLSLRHQDPATGRYKDVVVDIEWMEDGRAGRSFELTLDKKNAEDPGTWKVMHEYLVDPAEPYTTFRNVSRMVGEGDRPEFMKGMTKEFGDAPVPVVYRMQWFYRTDPATGETVHYRPDYKRDASGKVVFEDLDRYGTKIWLLPNHPFYNNFLALESPPGHPGDVSINFWYIERMAGMAVPPPGVPGYQYSQLYREEADRYGAYKYQFPVTFSTKIVTDPQGKEHEVVNPETITRLDLNDPASRGRVRGYYYALDFTSVWRDTWNAEIRDVSGRPIIRYDDYKIGEYVRGRFIPTDGIEVVLMDLNDTRMPVAGWHIELKKPTRQWEKIERDMTTANDGGWAWRTDFVQRVGEAKTIRDREDPPDAENAAMVREVFLDDVRVHEETYRGWERVFIGKGFFGLPIHQALGGAVTGLLAFVGFIGLFMLIPRIEKMIANWNLRRGPRRPTRQLPPAAPPAAAPASAPAPQTPPAAPGGPAAGGTASGARATERLNENMPLILDAIAVRGDDGLLARLREIAAEIDAMPEGGFPNGQGNPLEKSADLAKEKLMDTVITRLVIEGSTEEQTKLGYFDWGYMPWREGKDYKGLVGKRKSVLEMALDDTKEHRSEFKEELEDPLTYFDMYLFTLISYHWEEILYNDDQMNLMFYQARRAIREARKAAAKAKTKVVFPDIHAMTRDAVYRTWIFLDIQAERSARPVVRKDPFVDLYNFLTAPLRWLGLVKKMGPAKPFIAYIDRLNQGYMYGGLRPALKQKVHALSEYITGRDVNDYYRTPLFVRNYLTDPVFRAKVDEHGDLLIWLQDRKPSSEIAALGRNLNDPEARGALLGNRMRPPFGPAGVLSEFLMEEAHDVSVEYLRALKEAVSELLRNPANWDLDANGIKALFRNTVDGIKTPKGKGPYQKTYLDKTPLLSMMANTYWVWFVPQVVLYAAAHFLARDSIFRSVEALADKLHFNQPFDSSESLFFAGLGVLAVVIVTAWWGIRNTLGYLTGISFLLDRIRTDVADRVNQVKKRNLLLRGFVYFFIAAFTGLTVSAFQPMPAFLTPYILPIAGWMGAIGLWGLAVIVALFILYHVITIFWHGQRNLNIPPQKPQSIREAFQIYVWGKPHVNRPVPHWVGQTLDRIPLSYRAMRWLIILPGWALNMWLTSYILTWTMGPITELIIQVPPEIQFWTGHRILPFDFLYNIWEVGLWLSATALVYLLNHAQLMFIMVNFYALYIATKFGWNIIRGKWGIEKQGRLAEKAYKRLQKERADPATARLVKQALKNVKKIENLTGEGSRLTIDAAMEALKQSGVWDRIIRIQRERTGLATLSGGALQAHARGMWEALNGLIGEIPTQRVPGASALVTRPIYMKLYDDLVDLRNTVRAIADPRWLHRAPPPEEADFEAIARYKLFRNMVSVNADGSVNTTDSDLDERQMNVGYAKMQNFIVERLFERRFISGEERDSHLWAITDEDPNNRLSGVARRPKSAAAYKNWQAQKMQAYFMSSFFDERMPHMPRRDQFLPVELTTSIFIEEPQYLISQLDFVEPTVGQSMLSVIATQESDKWSNFIQSLVDQGILTTEQPEYWALLSFKHGDSLLRGIQVILPSGRKGQVKVTDPILQNEIRKFFSKEVQELDRTALGFEHTRKALVFWQGLHHPRETDSQVEQRTDFLFQLTLNHTPHYSPDFKPNGKDWTKRLSITKLQVLYPYLRINAEVSDTSNGEVYSIYKRRTRSSEPIVRALKFAGLYVETDNSPDLTGLTAADTIRVLDKAGAINRGALGVSPDAGVEACLAAAQAKMTEVYDHDRKAFLAAAFPNPGITNPAGLPAGLDLAEQVKRDEDILKEVFEVEPFDVVFPILTVGPIEIEMKKKTGTNALPPAGKPDGVANLAGMPERRLRLHIDVNQDMDAAEALKLPVFLYLMRGMDNVYKITAMEDVRSGRLGPVGETAADINLTFEFHQIAMDALNMHNDYGHNNQYWKEKMFQTGPYSRKWHITEDILGGMTANAMGKMLAVVKVAGFSDRLWARRLEYRYRYVTFIRFVKQREVAYINYAKMTGKFALSSGLKAGRESAPGELTPAPGQPTPHVTWGTSHLASHEEGGWYAKKLFTFLLTLEVVMIVVTYGFSAFIALSNPISWGFVGGFLALAILTIVLQMKIAEKGLFWGFLSFLALAPVYLLVFLGILSFSTASVFAMAFGVIAYLATGRGMGLAWFRMFSPPIKKGAEWVDYEEGSAGMGRPEVFAQLENAYLKINTVLFLIALVGTLLYWTPLLFLSAIYFAIVIFDKVSPLVLFNRGGTPLSGIRTSFRIYVGDWLSPFKILVHLHQLVSSVLFPILPSWFPLGPFSAEEIIKFYPASWVRSFAGLPKGADPASPANLDRVKWHTERLTGAVELWIFKLIGALPVPGIEHRVPDHILQPSYGFTHWTVAPLSSWFNLALHFTLILVVGAVAFAAAAGVFVVLTPFRLIYKLFAQPHPEKARLKAAWAAGHRPNQALWQAATAGSRIAGRDETQPEEPDREERQIRLEPGLPERPQRTPWWRVAGKWAGENWQALSAATFAFFTVGFVIRWIVNRRALLAEKSIIGKKPAEAPKPEEARETKRDETPPTATGARIYTIDITDEANHELIPSVASWLKSYVDLSSKDSASQKSGKRSMGTVHNDRTKKDFTFHIHIDEEIGTPLFIESRKRDSLIRLSVYFGVYKGSGADLFEKDAELPLILEDLVVAGVRYDNEKPVLIDVDEGDAGLIRAVYLPIERNAFLKLEIFRRDGSKEIPVSPLKPLLLDAAGQPWQVVTRASIVEGIQLGGSQGSQEIPAGARLIAAPERVVVAVQSKASGEAEAVRLEDIRVAVAQLARTYPSKSFEVKIIRDASEFDAAAAGAGYALLVDEKSGLDAGVLHRFFLERVKADAQAGLARIEARFAEKLGTQYGGLYDRMSDAVKLEALLRVLPVHTLYELLDGRLADTAPRDIEIMRVLSEFYGPEEMTLTPAELAAYKADAKIVDVAVTYEALVRENVPLDVQLLTSGLPRNKVRVTLLLTDPSLTEEKALAALAESGIVKPETVDRVVHVPAGLSAFDVFTLMRQVHDPKGLQPENVKLLGREGEIDYQIQADAGENVVDVTRKLTLLEVPEGLENIDWSLIRLLKLNPGHHFLRPKPIDWQRLQEKIRTTERTHAEAA